MSCISPVDIKTSTKTCSSNCSYKYTYGNSSCTLVNKETYVQIKLSSSNTVTFNDSTYSLVDVRLYAPSLHTWGGVPTDAELVLNHMGPSSNLYICIPIKTKDGKGESNEWFKKFMKFIPTNKESDEIIAGVTKFSLNDVVPQGPYYYYQGTSPWCIKKNTGGSKNKLIVFDMDEAITINKSDYTHFNRIMPSNIPVRSTPTDLFFNSTGTKNGFTSAGNANKSTDVIDCVPVSIDGKELKGKQAAYEEVTSYSSMKQIPEWFWTSIAIIGGIIFLFLLYFVIVNGLGATKLPAFMKLPRSMRRDPQRIN